MPEKTTNGAWASVAEKNTDLHFELENDLFLFFLAQVGGWQGNLQNAFGVGFLAFGKAKCLNSTRRNEMRCGDRSHPLDFSVKVFRILACAEGAH